MNGDKRVLLDRLSIGASGGSGKVRESQTIENGMLFDSGTDVEKQSYASPLSNRLGGGGCQIPFGKTGMHDALDHCRGFSQVCTIKSG